MINDINIYVDRDRCYACGLCVDRCILDNLRLAVAPCRQACPINMNCQGYIRLLAQGKPEEAVKEMEPYRPFAALLGRVDTLLLIRCELTVCAGEIAPCGQFQHCCFCPVGLARTGRAVEDDLAFPGQYGLDAPQ